MTACRSRVGGRIWTQDPPGSPVPIELGAEFIHGRPAPTFELMRRFGVAAVDTQGPHWTCRRGRLSLRGDVFRKVHDALRRNRARLRARSAMDVGIRAHRCDQQREERREQGAEDELHRAELPGHRVPHTVGDEVESESRDGQARAEPELPHQEAHEDRHGDRTRREDAPEGKITPVASLQSRGGYGARHGFSQSGGRRS